VPQPAAVGGELPADDQPDLQHPPPGPTGAEPAQPVGQQGDDLGRVAGRAGHVHRAEHLTAQVAGGQGGPAQPDVDAQHAVVVRVEFHRQPGPADRAGRGQVGALPQQAGVQQLGDCRLAVAWLSPVRSASSSRKVGPARSTVVNTALAAERVDGRGRRAGPRCGWRRTGTGLSGGVLTVLLVTASSQVTPARGPAADSARGRRSDCRGQGLDSVGVAVSPDRSRGRAAEVDVTARAQQRDGQRALVPAVTHRGDANTGPSRRRRSEDTTGITFRKSTGRVNKQPCDRFESR